MGGRQKQRERRRQQKEAAKATQSESSTEAPLTEEDEDASMVTHLMQMATAAGMRVVNRDIVRQIWTSIPKDEDKLWDIDDTVMTVMQEAQVENCDEAAGYS